MNISDFTKREVEHLIDECNFTDTQQSFFLLRSKGISIESCAELMNISVSCANALSKKVREKVNKVQTY